MKLFYKVTLICCTIVMLFMLTLLPSWLTADASQSTAKSDQAPIAASLIRSAATITFTPVATIYLPLVTRGEALGPTPDPTDEPGAPNIKIVRIEYDPASGTDAEGEHVDIQNLGSSTVDMTGWTLRDEVNTIFTFPAFSLSVSGTVRVWVKDGSDDATNLYWGRGSAVWNNGGDTATLRDAAEAEVDQCSYPGGAPGFFDCVP